jgi:hypothetical protein
MNEFIDSGKKAKKKSDYIFYNNNINNEYKIQNDYILLSNKNNLLKNKYILEQYILEKKKFFESHFKNYSNESKTSSNCLQSTQEI